MMIIQSLTILILTLLTSCGVKDVADFESSHVAFECENNSLDYFKSDELEMVLEANIKILPYKYQHLKLLDNRGFKKLSSVELEKYEFETTDKTPYLIHACIFGVPAATDAEHFSKIASFYGVQIAFNSEEGLLIANHSAMATHQTPMGKVYYIVFLEQDVSKYRAFWNAVA